MIDQLEGQLVEVRTGSVAVRHEALTYEILTPVRDEVHWRNHEGEMIGLHTIDYLESQGQGSFFLPRLIGFVSESDRDFFRMFTTVKGIGYRKALRAMAMPTESLAEAIASRDVSMLKTLPEIGKRTAETIIAELHDKVEGFILTITGGGRVVSVEDGRGSATIEAKPESRRRMMARDAVAVLVQLGENRMVASQWVDRVLAENEKIETVERIVNAAFQYREG